MVKLLPIEPIASSKEKEDRKSEIIELLKKGGKRWSELKRLTGLSSSTLYRIMNELEEDNLIEQEYKRKKLLWKLTKGGKKQLLIKEFTAFYNKGINLPLGVFMDFDHWKKRKEPMSNDKKTKPLFTETEDYEYFSLLKEDVAKRLLEDMGKDIVAKFRKEEPLMTTFVLPEVILSCEPNDQQNILKFVKKNAEKISKNRAALARWMLPKKLAKPKNRDKITCEAYILYKVEINVHPKIADKILKCNDAEVA